ncbi:hypothetical protein BVRB_042890, partial [Beta vulgaris subsp. vulgaris]
RSNSKIVPSNLPLSHADKYKTLPSNFLSRNPISSGSKMLWKYLEELGYKPSVLPQEDPIGSEQENVSDQPAANVINSVSEQIASPPSKPALPEKDTTRRELDELNLGNSTEDVLDEQSEKNDSGYEETVPVLGQLLQRPHQPVAVSDTAAIDQGYSFDWTCSSVSDMQW